MNKRNGFTLVELIVSLTIVVLLATAMIGAFNAIGITNKGRDAQRKKDLGRIKIAMEEYFNDKGSYPADVDTWNIKSNCHSTTVFAPYLVPWPCDPNEEPYKIIVDKNQFRVFANLENKTDKDIPPYWYEDSKFMVEGLGKNDVNYGVSSSNILWYDLIPPDSSCDTTHCVKKPELGEGCGDAMTGCIGYNCFYWDNSSPGSCTTKCQTYCCGSKCD